jgi:hypothetical protein
MSKPFKFEPSDFMSAKGPSGRFVRFEDAAAIANAKLASWLASAPVMHGRISPDGDWEFESFTDERAGVDTHRALLVDIQELPKKECEHLPDFDAFILGPKGASGPCIHCGVKLTAVWKESES